jgi:hypothetical protein
MPQRGYRHPTTYCILHREKKFDGNKLVERNFILFQDHMRLKDSHIFNVSADCNKYFWWIVSGKSRSLELIVLNIYLIF